MTRRGFLGGCAAAASTLAVPSAFASLTRIPERHLAFHHLHTGENLKVTYWAEGEYLNEGLRDINHLLRDHRTGEQYKMDPTLLDLLHTLQHRVEKKGRFHIISGYRSPKTNKMLSNNSSGVAKRSLHMQGKAIDIRLPGVDIRHLHSAAKSLKVGGVGLYTKSDFVHVDTGRVRYW